jgi:hypothetical protein
VPVIPTHSATHIPGGQLHFINRTCRAHYVYNISVYWIPLLQILEARGLQVFLVNARHVKNVPGRKSDVSDCQWLQYLHSVGLLHGSYPRSLAK